MNVISVCMLFYPSNPEILRSIFAVPNVALMNVMASRVFRNTMLFETRGGREISTVQFQEILPYNFKIFKKQISRWEGCNFQ